MAQAQKIDPGENSGAGKILARALIWPRRKLWPWRKSIKAKIIALAENQ
jgi:hypothetical protein